MSGAVVARLELVPADVVVPLRRTVLRPGLPVELVDYPYDREPDTIHVAAFDDPGTVVGCATFFPSPLPGELAADPVRPDGATWNLRGMATVARLRGHGIGGAVLEFGVAEVVRRGGTAVWCNGRVRAGDFYRRHGFVSRGEQFHVEPSGPHYVFVRSLG